MLYQNIESNKRKSTLLILIFICLIAGLGYLISIASDAGAPVFFLALVFSVIMSLGSWFAGDKMALWSSGAQPITESQNPELYRLVQNLSITAGIPMPKLYIINDSNMNAFATGRDPEHASVAVTTGLLQTLNRSELEGVLAHELSHIGNYDTRILMLTIFLVGLVGLIGEFFIRSQLFGDNRRNNNGLIIVIAFLAAILGRILAQLLHLAISRKREFLADASGVLLTRYPEGLISALHKIGQSNVPSKTANSTVAPLYFTNPFGQKIGQGIARLFSTHPPIEERIKALES
jgi:heat shock protein HtpX